jgi:TolA-binding protein
MINRKQLQLIEKYYQGELDGAEKKLFQQLKKEDEAFRKEVAAYKKIYQGLGGLHIDHLQSKMTQWESKHSATTTTKVVEMPVQKSSWKRYLSIAASVAIFLSVSFLYQSAFNDPFEDHFQAELSYATDLQSIRSSGEVNQGALVRREGFTAYETKAYDKASQHLKDYINNFEAESKNDYQAYLVLAVSELAQDKAVSAIAYLDVILQGNDSNNRYDAEWMWALAQYKNEQKEESIRMLNKIITNKRHTYQEKAVSFLDKIKE